MMSRFALSFGVFAVAIMTLGCGGPSLPVAKTTGQVTINGNPIEGATVNMATDGNSIIAYGVTDASGNFSMSTAFGGQSYEGAPIGKVTVWITKAQAQGMPTADPNAAPADEADPLAAANKMAKMMEAQGKKSQGGMLLQQKSEIPEKYTSPATSGLDQTIDADPSKNVFNFALDG